MRLAAKLQVCFGRTSDYTSIPPSLNLKSHVLQFKSSKVMTLQKNYFSEIMGFYSIVRNDLSEKRSHTHKKNGSLVRYKTADHEIWAFEVQIASY